MGNVTNRTKISFTEPVHVNWTSLETCLAIVQIMSKYSVNVMLVRGEGKVERPIYYLSHVLKDAKTRCNLAK